MMVEWQNDVKRATLYFPPFHGWDIKNEESMTLIVSYGSHIIYTCITCKYLIPIWEFIFAIYDTQMIWYTYTYGTGMILISFFLSLFRHYYQLSYVFGKKSKLCAIAVIKTLNA